MRQVKVAALQFSCSKDVQENINKAEKMVREAADNGANIILLPELFERQYFCQEKRYDYYDYALPLEKNPAVNRFKEVAKELGVVIPVSFYERDIDRLFNTVAMIDADGSVLGIYRKTHIPDDHFKMVRYLGAYTSRKKKLCRCIQKMLRSISRLVIQVLKYLIHVLVVLV